MLPTPNALGSQGLAIDGRGLNDLKRMAGDQSPQAIQQTAKQFEALFMRELLKSMREATMKSGLLDNESGNLGAQMLDEQFAVKMTGMPGGLSDMIARQLSQQAGLPAPGASSNPAPANAALVPRAAFKPTVPVAAAAAKPASARQAEFVATHTEAAQAVAEKTGIPSAFLLGQAGHETGWGRREIVGAGGQPSHNLFGIKAGASWKGPVAEVTTTEFFNGEPRKVKAKFRAYASYEQAFEDYAKLIGNSPRYAKALDQTHSAKGYAMALQAGGYATDPQYATKLSRAIEMTQQVQRQLA